MMLTKSNRNDPIRHLPRKPSNPVKEVTAEHMLSWVLSEWGLGWRVHSQCGWYGGKGEDTTVCDDALLLHA